MEDLVWRGFWRPNRWPGFVKSGSWSLPQTGKGPQLKSGPTTAGPVHRRGIRGRDSFWHVGLFLSPLEISLPGLEHLPALPRAQEKEPQPRSETPDLARRIREHSQRRRTRNTRRTLSGQLNTYYHTGERGTIINSGSRWRFQWQPRWGVPPCLELKKGMKKGKSTNFKYGKILNLFHTVSRPPPNGVARGGGGTANVFPASFLAEQSCLRGEGFPFPRSLPLRGDDLKARAMKTKGEGA